MRSTVLWRACLRTVRGPLLLPLAMGLTMISVSSAGNPDGAATDRLLSRMDRYYGLLRGGNYGSAYRMLAATYRGSRKDKQEWVNYARDMAKSVTVVDWRLLSGSVLGDTARLRMEHHLKSQIQPSQWQVTVASEDEFWVCENGDWYYIPIKLVSWDESKASPLPLPNRGNKVTEVEIRPRK